MIALTDNQLAIVANAASALSVEKRDTCAAQLERRGRFGDADVDDFAQRALHGLIQQQPAAYDKLIAATSPRGSSG